MYNLKDIVEIATNLITILAILIGGVWTLWRFVFQREKHSKVEFNIDLRVLAEFENEIIIELAAIIENKGISAHYIKDFTFSLLYLKRNEEIDVGGDFTNNQICFNTLIEKNKWLPFLVEEAYIESGVKKEYTHITLIPKDTSIVLLISSFKYPAKEDFYGFAKKAFKIG